MCHEPKEIPLHLNAYGLVFDYGSGKNNQCNDTCVIFIDLGQTFNLSEACANIPVHVYACVQVCVCVCVCVCVQVCVHVCIHVIFILEDLRSGK